MNEHSARYDRVKAWYDTGRWTAEMVHNAVGKWITEDEYTEIVGEVGAV